MPKAKYRNRNVRPGEPPRQLHPMLAVLAELEEAENLRRARKLEQAQIACEAIVKRFPDYVGALHTLGLVHADKGDYQRAMTYLAQAVMLNPKDWNALTALSGVYLRLGAKVMAARTLEQASEHRPNDANILATLGEIYREEKEYEAAARAYRKAYDLDKTLFATALGLGLSNTHLGRFSEAAEAFEETLKQGSRSLNLIYSLSQLPAQFVKNDVLSLIEDVVRDESEPKAEFDAKVGFAKAAALDRSGRYEDAWLHLVEANRHQSLKSRDQYRKDLKFRRETLLPAARKYSIMADYPKPHKKGYALSLFILGPSRSGKTTLEKLVGSHDCVKRGYENQIVENAVRRAFQTASLPTRSWIIEMPQNLDELYRDFYFEELEERAGSAQIFTNTLPGQISGVLRLATILPEARFLFVKRNIHDLSLRIYMKMYRSGNAYAYDLENIREYVEWYYQMIDIIAERLPHVSRVIQYEEMTENPAKSLRTVSELCSILPLEGPLPELGNDRGCAVPYQEFMQTA